METQRTDVVVIGAGLAGLVAAITAAKAGSRVVLLDGRAVGGRARSARRDGYTLNEGAHALYRGGPAARTLTELGVVVRGCSPEASTYRLVWDGEIVTLPGSARTLTSTRIVSARSKAKLAGWFAGAQRHAARSGEISVADWFDSQRAAPDLRKLVTALLRLGSYTAHPERAAAAPLLRQLALGAGGVTYVDGGWQSIVDQLVAVAMASGVEVVDHEPVVMMDTSGPDRLVITRTSTVVAPSVVIAAGGPQVAATLVGGDPAGWVERSGPVQRAAVLDVGGPPAEHRFLLSADEPLYLSTHAPVADLAPPGRHLVTMMRYLDENDARDAVVDRATLERHAALAGVAAPPERDVERFLAAPVVSWGSPLPGVERPTGFELVEQGVLVAGDWVGDHLLADAAVSSGAAAGLAAARRVVVSR
jgi:phytoene dehydrogenase-like protein